MKTLTNILLAAVLTLSAAMITGCAADRDNPYDPGADNYGDFYLWRSKASLPTSARYGASAVSYNDSVYVMGGFNGSSLNYNHIYDTINNSWDTTKNALPSSRYYLCSALVSAKIYVIGGYNAGNLDYIDEYNIVGNSWIRDTGNGGILNPMPTSRSRLASAVIDNIIYVIGGYNGSYLTKIESYNPSTNTWIEDTGGSGPLAPMPTARCYLSATTVNNIIYVIGGTNDGTNALTAVEAFDPSGGSGGSGSWSTKASLPVGRFGHVSVVLNNKIYVIGGYDGSDYLSSVVVYNPSTNSWSTCDSMITERRYLAAAVADERIIVVGGNNSINTYLSINEAYEPFYP